MKSPSPNSSGRPDLLAFIREIADGELACEQARGRLNEVSNFSPQQAFQIVKRIPGRDVAAVGDVHDWLAGQPHRLPRLFPDDVAVFILPLCDHHSGAEPELHIEGFLQLVLPAKDGILRSRSLSRTPATAGPVSLQLRGLPVTYGEMSAEAKYRLCQLLEEEVRLARHLQFHRRTLQEAQVSPRDVLNFLSSMAPTAPNGCSLSNQHLRRSLVERLGEHSMQQSDAFFRRAALFGADPEVLTLENFVGLCRLHLRDASHVGAVNMAALDLMASVPSTIVEYPRQIDGERQHAIYNPHGRHLDPAAREATFLRPSGKVTMVGSVALKSAANCMLARPGVGTPPAGERLLLRQPDVLADQSMISFTKHDVAGLEAVLKAVQLQGRLDCSIEEAKSPLPTNLDVEVVFATLDTDMKGHVDAEDLCKFVRPFSYLALSSAVALAQELQHGRQHEPGFIGGGQLSFCEVAALFCKKGSPGREVLNRSISDDQARVALRQLHLAEWSDTGGVLSAADQRELSGVVDVAALAADEVELLRKQLLCSHSKMAIADIFDVISGGKDFITFADLRRVLLQHRCWSSERELQLIWHRYARGGDLVKLPAFMEQLQPAKG